MKEKQFRADDWVTIHGTHVYIDGSGRITKGPAGMTGGTVGDLSKKKKTTATMTTGQKVTVKGVEYEKMKSGKLKYKTPDTDTKLSHRYLTSEALDKKIAKAGGIDRKSTSEMKTGDKIKVKGVEFEKTATGSLKYTDPHGKVRYKKPEDVDAMILKDAGKTGTPAATPKPATAPAAKPAAPAAPAKPAAPAATTADKTKAAEAATDALKDKLKKIPKGDPRIGYKIESAIKESLEEAGVGSVYVDKDGTEFTKTHDHGGIDGGPIFKSSDPADSWRAFTVDDLADEDHSPVRKIRSGDVKFKEYVGKDSAGKGSGPKSAKDMATGSKVSIGGVSFEKTATGTFKYTDPHGKVRYVKPEEMEKRMEKAKAKGTLGDVTDAGSATKAATTAATPADKPSGEKKESKAEGDKPKSGLEAKRAEYEGKDTPETLKGADMVDRKKIGTLENYAKTVEAYKKGPHGKNIDKKVHDYAKANGLPEDFVEQAMKAAVDQGAIRSATGFDGICGIIRSGELMNQFKSGYSHGADFVGDKDGGMRGVMSHRTFGTDVKKTGIKNLETYGYLTSADGDTSGYGDFIINFKKKTMGQRTTFTCDDSLGVGRRGEVVGGDLMHPSRYAIPDAYGSDSSIRAWGKLYESYKKTGKIDFDSGTWRTANAGCYMECQFHGLVGLSDMESVSMSKRNASRLPKDVKDKMAANGIKIIYTD